MKNELRLVFSAPLSLCLPLVSVYCMSLSLCLPDCCLVSLSVPVSMSMCVPNISLSLNRERERAVTDIYKELSH